MMSQLNEILYAGIDIGGTNTEYGLIDEKGKILCRGSIKTGDFDEPEVFTSQIAGNITQLLSAFPESRLRGIGIGAPNGNYFRSEDVV